MKLELCAIPITPSKTPWLPSSTASEVETFNAALRDLGDRVETHAEAVQTYTSELDLLGTVEDLSRAREGLRVAVVGLYQDMIRTVTSRSAIVNAVLAAVQEERRRLEAAIAERTAAVKAALEAAGISEEAMVLDRDAAVMQLRRQLDVIRAMPAAVTPQVARSECDQVVRVAERELRTIFTNGLVGPVPEA